MRAAHAAAERPTSPFSMAQNEPPFDSSGAPRAVGIRAQDSIDRLDSRATTIDGLRPSPMPTANSDVLRPLVGTRMSLSTPEMSESERLCSELAQSLSVVRRQFPGVNFARLLACELGRMAWRNRVRVLPAAVGGALGFVTAQGFLTEAGFNELIPIRALPFNPEGVDHRSRAAFMVGWAFAFAVLSAVTLGVAFERMGRLGQRWLGFGRFSKPTSEVADILVADARRLEHSHRRMVRPVFLLALANYIWPVCLCTEAGFNFLRPIDAKPFNPGGVADPTLAGALLGWGLTLSFFGGLPVGVGMGVGVGWVWRQLAGRES